MNLAGLIGKAKRLLHGAQREAHPRQAVARLEEAWSKADQYKKNHSLDAQEETTFDAALLLHLRRHAPSDPYSEIALTTFVRRLDEHTDDYFESALAALRQFRVQRAEWRARPVKQVVILPEADWQPDWRRERRLALLFEPEIAESWDEPVIRPVWLPRWPNRLEFIGQASDFTADAAWRANALDSISISRRGEQDQWQGSSFSIRESDSAMELWGQAHTSHAPINASISLACMTFDHLRQRLEAAARETPKTDRLLLACGFMAGNTAIPRPRPVEPNEKIRNPDIIEQDTPRTWFEIVRVVETDGPMRMESVQRWMTVEAAE